MNTFAPRSGEYLQLNPGGITDPLRESFPPITERITQDPAPDRAIVKHEIQRTTIQWDDNCNLRCGGCYARRHLPHGGSIRDQNELTTTPDDVFHDQLTAHGDSLSEVYLLGLEPTLNPTGTADKIRRIGDKGMTAVSITNGARGPEAFWETFGEGIEGGVVSRVNISLDSIDEDINNALRGRSYAFKGTMETIRSAIEAQVDIQISITVWAQNYHTIMDTVQALYDMGARGFNFHEGSLEGVDNAADSLATRIQPLEWRALVSQLAQFCADHRDELKHFQYPFIYFTESELADTYIGDPDMAAAYLEHVDRLEAGEESQMPFYACPALDVPQIYVFGNDGKFGRGAMSLCNMHTLGSSTYLASFNPDSRDFEVAEGSDNQMSQMMASDSLCPAREAVTKDGNRTDRYETSAGKLYHTCRYVSSNQFPDADLTVGEGEYSAIAEGYREASESKRQNLPLFVVGKGRVK